MHLVCHHCKAASPVDITIALSAEGHERIMINLKGTFTAEASLL
jgi:hypothetical protein